MQEAFEAEAERDMAGIGRSISTMSFGSGEREQLAHQFSGNVLGSAPALAKTGAPLMLKAALTGLTGIRSPRKHLGRQMTLWTDMLCASCNDCDLALCEQRYRCFPQLMHEERSSLTDLRRILEGICLLALLGMVQSWSDQGSCSIMQQRSVGS